MLYQVLDELLPEGYLVAGDVGCSILHGYFPPQVIDTAYALGTSIATAAGMSLSGRKGVAIIGDTGFIHSGITGLLNAVEHGLKERARGEIRILLEDLGDAVVIKIEDNGPGLPADFNPAHASHSLGLQIINTLVTDDLKGTLQMESIYEEGEGGHRAIGARATVTLPKRSAWVG
jgi:nitrogen fixation/metabolism regulation signal transduction histidine kinase